MGLPGSLNAGPLAYQIKHKDVVFGTSPLSNNTFIVNQVCNLMFAPTESSDEDGRIGRRTQLVCIRIHAKIDAALQVGSFGLGVDYKPHLVRYVIVVDNQCSGAAICLASDIFLNPVDPHWLTGGAAATPLTKYPIHSYCLKNLENKERFKFLFDKVFMLGGTTAKSTLYIEGEGKQSYLLNKVIKCDVDTIFSASTSAITDITTGAVLSLCLGGYVAGTNDPTITGKMRCEYLDA